MSNGLLYMYVRDGESRANWCNADIAPSTISSKETPSRSPFQSFANSLPDSSNNSTANVSTLCPSGVFS